MAELSTTTTISTGHVDAAHSGNPPLLPDPSDSDVALAVSDPPVGSPVVVADPDPEGPPLVGVLDPPLDPSSLSVSAPTPGGEEKQAPATTATATNPSPDFTG